MASISCVQLIQFHKIDRHIFSGLVLKLKRDIAKSLLMMALWMWLEDIGHPDIIATLAGYPYTLIDEFAVEAAWCLEAITSSVPSDGGLPLTQTLTTREISLHILNKLRFSAVSGIKSFLNNVCARIFTDIIQQILGTSSTSNVPGFPHPSFGSLVLVPLPAPSGYVDVEFKFWEWDSSGDTSEDDRILFLTFSRGFPVSEAEVKLLFKGTFGAHRVKNVYMGKGSGTHEQSLYATLVVDSIATVDRILDGNRIAKFRINGKYVWARKYDRRDRLNE